MIEFIIHIALVALGVKFIMTLADKWGIREWLQRNAPSPFLAKLFSCDFCCSWWLGIIVCIPLAICVHWYLIFVPIFSSNLR